MRTPVDFDVLVVFSTPLKEDVSMSVRITVLLEEDVDASFTAFCHDKGFKKSTLAARLIREHLALKCDPPPSTSTRKSLRVSSRGHR